MDRRAPVVEVMDDTQVEIIRKKSPAERLAIAFDMWDFAHGMIHANLQREYPTWTVEEVNRETARRIGLGGNS